MVSLFSFFPPFDNLKKLEKYSLATESGHEPNFRLIASAARFGVRLHCHIPTTLAALWLLSKLWQYTY